jgi:hypothetical protein
VPVGSHGVRSHPAYPAIAQALPIQLALGPLTLRSNTATVEQ